jgi:hypothetical protein
MAYLPVSPQEFVDRCTEWVVEVIRPHAIPLADGSDPVPRQKYYALDLGDGILAYSIAENAPGSIQDAINAFNDLRVLRFQLSEANPTGPDLRFIIGSVFAFAQHSQQVIDPKNPKAAEICEKFLQNCAKGGAATRLTTDEQDSLVVEIYNGFKSKGLSNNGAYARTVDKLNSEHGILMSPSTVRRRVASA